MNRQYYINNRLYGMRAYLCGSIENANDGGNGWRDTITPELEDIGVCVFNPCKKEDYIDKGFEGEDAHTYRQNLLKEEKYQEVAKEMKLLRVIDMRMVDLSDFIIAHINPDIHLTGTYEELFWANRGKKPILVVVEQGLEKVPPWLWGTLPTAHFYPSFNSLLSYLNYVDTNLEDPPHLKRWTFFEYEKMMPKRPPYTQHDGKKYKMVWEEV
jgi:hypothetical protein